jgi:hypothetical protein
VKRTFIKLLTKRQKLARETNLETKKIHINDIIEYNIDDDEIIQQNIETEFEIDFEKFLDICEHDTQISIIYNNILLYCDKQIHYSIDLIKDIIQLKKTDKDVYVQLTRSYILLQKYIKKDSYLEIFYISEYNRNNIISTLEGEINKWTTEQDDYTFQNNIDHIWEPICKDLNCYLNNQLVFPIITFLLLEKDL